MTIPKAKSKATGGEWSEEDKEIGMLLCYDKLLYDVSDEKSKPSIKEMGEYLEQTLDNIYERFEGRFTKEQVLETLRKFSLEKMINTIESPLSKTKYSLTEEGLERRFEFTGVYFL